MIVAMIAAALYCQKPVIENKTDTWTEQDQMVMQEIMHKKLCAKQSILEPCMIKFIKNADSDYDVQCGPEKRRSET
jgi:hypothetical protein